MSIFKYDNKWGYVVRLKTKSGITKQYRRRGFELKKDALNAQREFIENFNNDEEDISFASLAEKYKSYSVGRKKETSIYNQNHLIDTILIPHFADKNIHELKPNDIDKFYRAVTPHYSYAYVQQMRTVLSAILNHGINFYELRRNVTKAVKIPSIEDDEDIKYWTLEQFNYFIKTVEHPIYKAMFNILFWTGLRKGELLALRPMDIDFNQELIHVKSSWNGKQITSPKNKSSKRDIGIPTHLIQEVQRLIDYQKTVYADYRSTDYLFAIYNPEKPMAPANVNKQLKKYTEPLDLPPIRVHHFRHSHATLLINNGVSLYIVSKHLGHSDIHTTANIYGHLYPNSEKEVSQLLNRKFEGE
ncbi:tyrosine-type recombinase/integrase [Staphylococcus pettenkoferi]|uniref:tyrosine-type recombinase/integrase n=1 Tax=Staphylococcus pettenkoferi TaxID=170573 RepID=UPI0011A0BB01|nr:tyrosine-type recombinase/integrase [Staphylococcus pettenkoferi]